MTSLLTDKFIGNNLRIVQSVGSPGAQAIAGIDQLLLVLPEKVPASVWRKVPQGLKLKTLMKRRAPGRVPAVSSRVNNKRQTAIHAATLNAGDATFERLSFARKLTAAALQERAGTIGIWVLGFDSDEQARLVNDVIAAALAAAFRLPEFKSKPAPPRMKSIRLIGMDRKARSATCIGRSQGQQPRSLAHRPARQQTRRHGVRAACCASWPATMAGSSRSTALRNSEKRAPAHSSPSPRATPMTAQP